MPDPHDKRMYLIDGLTLKQILSIIKEFYSRNPEFEDELRPIAKKLINLEDVTEWEEGEDPSNPDVLMGMSEEAMLDIVKDLEDELEILRDGLDQTCDLKQLLKQTGIVPNNKKS